MFPPGFVAPKLTDSSPARLTRPTATGGPDFRCQSVPRQAHDERRLEPSRRSLGSRPLRALPPGAPAGRLGHLEISREGIGATVLGALGPRYFFRITPASPGFTLCLGPAILLPLSHFSGLSWLQPGEGSVDQQRA